MDKPVMYRGVAVGEPLSAGSKMAKDTSDKPKTKSSKKKMYRGVEI